MSYSPGDIILVNFPYREDKNLFSKRPAFVIKNMGNGTHKVCQITGTDRRGELKGEWIDPESSEYEPMNLRKPSFINFENIIDLPNSLIIHGPIGKYPNAEKLLKIHNIS